MSKFYSRVAVVSILTRIDNPETIDFNELYQLIGLNTGNFMFTNAVYKQISAEMTCVGFDFDPNIINRNFDVMVIPAANWLRKDINWEWFLERIKCVEIPLVVIGIGLQANSIHENEFAISESAYKLVSLFSEKSISISCRGIFTRDYLYSIGIKNVVATGCPSLYMKPCEVDASNHKRDTRPVIQGTRYWLTKSFIDSGAINRRLYLLAGQEDIPMIFQSEAEEICLLTRGDLPNTNNTPSETWSLLDKLYGKANGEADDYLKKNGRVFFDLSAWSNFVTGRIGVIGTRLHGCILALNSDVPSYLIPHDSRTQEIADFAKIPVPDVRLLNECFSDNKLEALLECADLESYQAARARNSMAYKQFLMENNLAVSYDNILD